MSTGRKGSGWKSYTGSSEISQKQKFAIISSLNTSRSLKCVKRPSPLTKPKLNLKSEHTSNDIKKVPKSEMTSSSVKYSSQSSFQQRITTEVQEDDNTFDFEPSIRDSIPSSAHIQKESIIEKRGISSHDTTPISFQLNTDTTGFDYDEEESSKSHDEDFISPETCSMISQTDSKTETQTSTYASINCSDTETHSFSDSSTSKTHSEVTTKTHSKVTSKTHSEFTLSTSDSYTPLNESDISDEFHLSSCDYPPSQTSPPSHSPSQKSCSPLHKLCNDNQREEESGIDDNISIAVSLNI